jgi:hypothetical protein
MGKVQVNGCFNDCWRGKKLTGSGSNSSSSSHARQAPTCTFSRSANTQVYTIPPPPIALVTAPRSTLPTLPSNSHIHTTHLRPSCLRICRPPAATSPSNTSATCPPAVSVPRPTSSWSAPSAPTVSGAWVRVSANKSMLATASTHLPTSAHLGNTSNGTFN